METDFVKDNMQEMIDFQMKVQSLVMFYAQLVQGKKDPAYYGDSGASPRHDRRLDHLPGIRDGGHAHRLVDHPPVEAHGLGASAAGGGVVEYFPGPGDL